MKTFSLLNAISYSLVVVGLSGLNLPDAFAGAGVCPTHANEVADSAPVYNPRVSREFQALGELTPVGDDILSGIAPAMSQREAALYCNRIGGELATEEQYKNLYAQTKISETHWTSSYVTRFLAFHGGPLVYSPTNTQPANENDRLSFRCSTPIRTHAYEIRATRNPDAIYKAVDHHEMEVLFGAKAAEKMGKAWRREGSRVVIGAPLMSEQGEPLRLTQIEAMKACLDLNDDRIQGEVQEAFLTQLQKNSHEITSRNDDQSSELSESGVRPTPFKPISGCYLLRKEDLEILESDFTASKRAPIDHSVEKYFNTGILPGLYGNPLWSSGIYSSSINYSWSLNERGHVEQHPSDLRMTVRCACAARPASY